MATNVSVVGLGKMGNLYVENIRKIPELNLVSVCDTNQNIPDLGVPIFSDYTKMLEKIATDFIIIATPEDTHFDMLQNIMQQNLNVLVEKPVCLTTEEADNLERLAAKSDSKVAVSYPTRYSRVLYNVGNFIHLAGLNIFKYEIKWMKNRVSDNRHNSGVMAQEGTHVIDLILHNLVCSPDRELTCSESVSISHDFGHDKPESSASFNLSLGGFPIACTFSYLNPTSEREVKIYCKDKFEKDVYCITMSFDKEKDLDGNYVDSYEIKELGSGSILVSKSIHSNKLFEQLNAVVNWTNGIKDERAVWPSGFYYDPRICTLEQGLMNVRLTNEIMRISEQDPKYQTVDIHQAQKI